MTSVFKGAKDKIIEIKIGDDLIRIKPKVKDAEALMTLNKDMGEKDVSRVTEIMKNLICRANPDEDPEDIEAYVAENYGLIFAELAILYKFSTREKMDKLLTEDSKKKE